MSSKVKSVWKSRLKAMGLWLVWMCVGAYGILLLVGLFSSLWQGEYLQPVSVLAIILAFGMFLWHKNRHWIWFRRRARCLAPRKAQLQCYHSNRHVYEAWFEGQRYIFYYNTDTQMCFVKSEVYTVPPFGGAHYFGECMKHLKNELKKIAPAFRLEVEVMSDLCRPFQARWQLSGRAWG